MNSADYRACLAHLQGTFGLTDFRPGQKAAASALLRDRDLFCILPTGSGKSLCWQLPALVRPGLTLVVSPLIALMNDQLRHLHRCGVPAVALHHLLSPAENEQAMAALQTGKTRILFVAPERLQQPSLRRLLQNLPPWLVVVDEAHCIVSWGKSFRPAYQEIGAFVERLRCRPVLCAMTATADQAMRRAIAEQLDMTRPVCVTLPVLRENLRYAVRTTLDRTQEILRLLPENGGRSVVFCRTRARTESLAKTLTEQGFCAACYHAGLDRETRIATENRFAEGSVQVLTATTAFGMGVDLPDIRLVIHDFLPGSVIDYAQQSGRAGRDGQEADCILLIDPVNIVLLSQTLRRLREREGYLPWKRFRFAREKLRPQQTVLNTTMKERCIPAAISRAFGQNAPPCGRCSACRNGPLMRRLPHRCLISPAAMTAVFLRLQRNAIAAKQGRPPNQVLSGHALRTAARTLALPKRSVPYDAGMIRLVETLRRRLQSLPALSENQSS